MDTQKEEFPYLHAALCSVYKKRLSFIPGLDPSIKSVSGGERILFVRAERVVKCAKRNWILWVRPGSIIAPFSADRKRRSTARAASFWLTVYRYKK